jgi:hypothetical protein
MKIRVAVGCFAAALMTGGVVRGRRAGNLALPAGSVHSSATGRVDRDLFRRQRRLRLGTTRVKYAVYGQP